MQLKTVFLIVLMGTFIVPSLEAQDGNWKLFPNKRDKKGNKKIEQVDTVSSVKVDTIDTMATAPKQEGLVLDTNSRKAGKVEIIEEYRISTLLYVADSLNKEKGTLNGFRIQIGAETGANSRARATAVQSEFLRLFPETPSYVLWENPNYKVRIGDFRTRLSAQGFHQKIKAQFPGAFLVPDEIQLPDLSDPEPKAVKPPMQEMNMEQPE